jgi:RNA polymerase sigma factor (sigma-70 family)
MDDSALLRQFAQTKSHAAFRDLAGRYTNLVYASALTRLRDAHAAQDVTQVVFLTLALKAKDLRPDTSLPGWLFTTTRYVAARYQRGEHRRQEREMRAFEQHQLHQPEAPSAVWEELQPHLAVALDSLSGADREAVLLRFYRQASHRQIAEQLRITENAAEKRVRKALDKMRQLFAKKGVTLSVAALAGGLTASASAAPVGFAGVVSGAVLTGTGGTLAATETLILAKGALKAMFIAKVKTVSLTAAACLIVAGTGIVAAKQLAGSSTSGTAQPESIQVAANPQPTQPQTPALPVVPESPSPRSTPAAPTVEGKIVKGLQLALSADKTETTPEGMVKVTIALINRGTDPIKYLQYPQICGPWLKITGPDGTAIKCIRDPRAPQTSLPAPDMEHVQELAPGAKWEHVEWVAWTVLDPPVENRNRITGKVIQRYDGCGWDIRKSGRYTIVASYGPIEDARRINAKHQPNVWDGEAESNPVVIIVQPAVQTPAATAPVTPPASAGAETKPPTVQPKVDPGVFTVRVTRDGMMQTAPYTLIIPVKITAVEQTPNGATDVPKVGERIGIHVPHSIENQKLLPGNCRVNLVRQRIAFQDHPKLDHWQYRFPNDFPATNIGDCQEVKKP